MSNRLITSMRSAVANGFTIIELMITIGLIAVVAVIAVPSFHGFLERNQIAAAINNFTGVLAVARSEAIKRKQLVTVCPRGNNGECQGTAYENGVLVKIDATNEVIWENDSLPPGYTLRGNGGIASQVRFRHDGRPVSFGSITLCRDEQVNKGRQLVINRTGRVRLVEQPNHCGV